MSNFLLVVDPDRTRRGDHVNAATRVWNAFTGATPVWHHGTDYALASGGTRQLQPSDDGGVALVVGDAFRSRTRERLSPLELFRSRDSHGRRDPIDGLHAALCRSEDGSWHVSADLLGIVPVYWCQNPGTCIVASSPELIRAHPCFRLQLDVLAVVGILLTGTQIGPRTIASGVRRLLPGAVLHIRPDASVTERQEYELPVSRESFGLPWKQQLHQLDEVLSEAVRRQTPTGSRWFALLSGGLDSRMVAAYLSQQGDRPPAVTFGDRADIEMRCATDVARELNWPHHPLPISSDGYCEGALWQSGWTYLAGGLNNFEYWQCRDRLASLGDHYLSGFVMDAVVGGSHVGWAFDKTGRAAGFDTFFRSASRYGLQADTLGRLFPSEKISDAVDAVQSAARSEFEALDGETAQRAWRFDLRNRQRLHVGTFAWTLSQAAWPVLPAADSRVLAHMAGLPPAAFSERRAQAEIIRSRFPRLAALPLDRNGTNDAPLAPSLAQQVRLSIKKRTERFRRSAKERRYYFRLYDFNGRGWRSVRRRAEAGWKRLDGFMDLRVARELVPPPDTDVSFRDGIIDSNGRKLLVGLALWAGERL